MNLKNGKQSWKLVFEFAIRLDGSFCLLLFHLLYKEICVSRKPFYVTDFFKNQFYSIQIALRILLQKLTKWMQSNRLQEWICSLHLLYDNLVDLNWSYLSSISVMVLYLLFSVSERIEICFNIFWLGTALHFYELLI